jgi:hypothetical protein
MLPGPSLVRRAVVVRPDLLPQLACRACRPQAHIIRATRVSSCLCQPANPPDRQPDRQPVTQPATQPASQPASQPLCKPASHPCLQPKPATQATTCMIQMANQPSVPTDLVLRSSGLHTLCTQLGAADQEGPGSNQRKPAWTQNAIKQRST